jgi:hypothetical protein
LKELQSDMAFSLYEKLKGNGGQWIVTPIAYILQIIGRTNRERFSRIIDFSSNDTYLIIGQIEALRLLSFEQRIDKDHIQKVIEQVESANHNLHLEALHFLLTAQIADIDATKKLMDLTSSNNMEVKRYIAQNCYVICMNNPEVALQLLTTLSQSSDVALINEIAVNLGCLGAIYPIQCLKIIQRWYSIDSLRNEMSLDWLPEEIGKGASEDVNAFLRSWIAEEDNVEVLAYHLPNLICNIFEKNDKKRLVEFLQSTNLKDKKQLKVVCKALEIVLVHQRTDQRLGRQLDPDFIDRSFSFVCQAAQERGIDPRKIEPEDNVKLRRTLAIINSLDNPIR